MTTALTDLSDIKIKAEGYSEECAKRIAALCRECFTDAWSPDAVTQMLMSEQNAVFTANGGEIGFAAASVGGDVADVLDIAVLPSYRGRRIGKALMTALLSELELRGVCEVFLEVRVSNLPAIALYTSLGFEICGERKNYYSSPKEDALIYKLSLRT